MNLETRKKDMAIRFSKSTSWQHKSFMRSLKHTTVSVGF